MLAGLGCGMFASLEEAASMRGAVRQFRRQLDEETRRRRLAGWAEAVAAVLSTTRS
jgi:glycerol kinase